MTDPGFIGMQSSSELALRVAFRRVLAVEGLTQGQKEHIINIRDDMLDGVASAAPLPALAGTPEVNKHKHGRAV